VTLEYPQDRMEGPPFAVLEAEVRTHWQGASVSLLAEDDAVGPRFAALGATGKNRIFAVSPKGS
jgi:thiopurine S-methyltransferase